MGRKRDSGIAKSDETNGKKRGSNFSSEEIDNMLEIVFDYSSVLLSRATDGATNKQKADTWAAIANKYNAMYPVSD